MVSEEHNNDPTNGCRIKFSGDIQSEKLLVTFYSRLQKLVKVVLQACHHGLCLRIRKKESSNNEIGDSGSHCCCDFSIDEINLSNTYKFGIVRELKFEITSIQREGAN